MWKFSRFDRFTKYGIYAILSMKAHPRDGILNFYLPYLT